MAYLTVDELAPPGHSGRTLVDSFTREERQRACEEASSTADSYFASKWGVPLPSPSPETRRRVRHVALYELLCGRGFNPENQGHQTILTNYQDAIRWFEQCAAGKVVPTSAPDATPDVEEGAPWVEAEEPRGWGGTF